MWFSSSWQSTPFLSSSTCPQEALDVYLGVDACDEFAIHLAAVGTLADWVRGAAHSTGPASSNRFLCGNALIRLGALVCSPSIKTQYPRNMHLYGRSEAEAPGFLHRGLIRLQSAHSHADEGEWTFSGRAFSVGW